MKLGDSLSFRKLPLVLLLILTLRPVSAQNSAIDAYQAGMHDLDVQDWKGAIAKFNEALQLDPKQAETYHGRAYARERLDDIDGSIADYTTAISLNPNIPKTYAGRGYGKYRKGDLDGAIVDYDKALSLDPTLVEALTSRGVAKLNKKDLDGAIADYTKAIRFDPNCALAYRMRGMVEYEKTYAPGADRNLKEQTLRDLHKGIDLNPNDKDYPRFFIWLIQAPDLASEADAMKELAAYVHTRPGKPDDWALQVELFLIGDITEGDLLQVADRDKRWSSIRHCEGYFYIGMKHAFNDDNAHALLFFRQCLATGETKEIEYQVAQARLQ
jgi:tetratricopeptide (TPR) repeat protein